MKYLSIILLLFIFGCTAKHENPQQSDIAGQIDSIQYVEKTPLFKIKALEDTLHSFINLTDTIYNPYNAPKINFVQLSISKKDTLINFTMYVALLDFIDDETYKFIEDSCFLIGACRINGENVVVYNLGLKSLKNILNEELLSIEYARSIDIDDSVRYDWDYFPSDWTYKLSGDSLIEVRRRTYIQPYQRRGIYFE